ncbi:MAG: PEP/pyruvate-binding domain-containing protein [Candidatus Cybelea sp.]
MRSSLAALVREDCLLERRFIRPFRTISNADVAVVGGKNASLGEMYRSLSKLGVRIPNGFAVTVDGHREVVTQAGLWDATPGARRTQPPTISRTSPRVPRPHAKPCSPRR